MTSSNGHIFRVTGPLCGNSPVTGEFPAQRPMTRSFDVFFYLRLEKRLSKQSWDWWFDMPSRSLWRHCNGFRQEQEGPDWWYLNIFFIKCTIDIFHRHRTCLFAKTVQMVHYRDVIISAMASQITSVSIVYSTVRSGEDQRKHQISASLAFVRGNHRRLVNSPHKWPVTRKMFPFDDVIMIYWLLFMWWRPIQVAVIFDGFEWICCQHDI